MGGGDSGGLNRPPQNDFGIIFEAFVAGTQDFAGRLLRPKHTCSPREHPMSRSQVGHTD